MSKLKISINGNWSAREMETHLRALHSMHEALAFRFSDDGLIDQTIRRAATAATEAGVRVQISIGPSDNNTSASRGYLKLTRSEFASPGFQDFVGIGKCLEQIRIFLTDLLEFKRTTESKKFEDSLIEQQVLEYKLKNLRETAAICRENGLSPEETSHILKQLFAAQEDLGTGVAKGLITNAQIYQEEREYEPAD